MKTLVQGEAKEPYQTTDITLIIALMSLGWRPIAISADNGIVQYTFENEDVREDVRDLLTNAPKIVTIQAVWAANQVWAMNLNRARS